MTLSQRVKKLLGLDEAERKWAEEIAQPVKWESHRVIHELLAHTDRTAALEAALCKCVEQLERECCCPGETNWTTGAPILCDPCEALTRLAGVCEGMEKR